MSKFNVGDRVRIVWSDTGEYTGKEGVVEYYVDSGDWPCVVRLVGEGQGLRFADAHLELVEEGSDSVQRKFRVGDKVRLNSDFIGGIRAGEIGVVTEDTGEKNSFSTLVRFDDHATPTNDWANGWHVFNEQLELIASSSTDNEGGSTVRKIAIGDRVRVIGESLEALRVEHDDHTIDAVGVVKGRNDAYDTWLVLLDDDDLRSPYSIEGTWAVEDSDVEHVDDAAKSIEVEVAAALVGDDRPARNGAMIDVDGETLDVEAMFYRMCAATTKRTRRRKAS